MSNHVIIYIPGLGDSRIGGRKFITASWRLYGVSLEIHQMDWADKEPFKTKLAGLLEHIDQLAGDGKIVSLVGESAGAGAATIAYASRQSKVSGVVCICGKLRNPQTVHPQTYKKNPAFAESMAALSEALASIGDEKLRRVRSIHPLFDSTVPVADTVIPGAQQRTLPSFGHATSIVLGNVLFSWLIVPFLKRN